MVEQCFLGDDCSIKNERKPTSRQTRIIKCRICSKAFHSLCINYHSKTEQEFVNAVPLFLCDNCFQLIHAISEQLHDKVSLPLVDVIGKLNTVTQELNEFKELKSNLSVNKYVFARTQTVSDNTPINTQNLETDNKIVDTTTEVDSTNNNSHKATSSNIISLPDNDTSANFSQIQSGYETKQTEAIQLKYFLCSIECELPLSDIEFIIKDANIPTADITFEETVGDFKRKKYIVIHSVDRIKIFNFRVAFMKSKLNGI